MLQGIPHISFFFATITFIPFINQAVYKWHRLFADKNSFSISQANEVKLFLFAGESYANSAYLLVGTLSGVSPGVMIGGGYHLPINIDDFSNWTLAYANTPFFPNFTGNMNMNGQALAGVKTGSAISPSFLGLTMHYAYVILFPIQFVSNAYPVTFTL